MSRSGYNDCINEDNRWQWIRWRGAVNSAIRGKRGQTFLRDLLSALDAMPRKELVSDGPVRPEGCCAMGALALHRSIAAEDMSADTDVMISACLTLLLRNVGSACATGPSTV